MAEQTQTDSTGSEKHLSYVLEVMRGNEQFLRENARDVYGEIINLVNDAADHREIIFKHPTKEEECVRRAMFYFLNHVLVPLSSAIWLDALSGNLLVCFIEMRSILEALVTCYLADWRYPDQEFYQERLRLLEDERVEICGKQKRVSISRRMKELGKHLGLEKDFVTLWGTLSGRWVHVRGVMNQVVDQIVDKSDVPPWALIVPVSFAENDMDELGELGKYLAQLRNLLKVTMENYDTGRV
jgi:hypothetical protein